MRASTPGRPRQQDLGVRSLAVVLMLAVELGRSVSLEDVAAIVEREASAVGLVLARFVRSGVLRRHGSSLVVGSPPPLSEARVRALATVAELVARGDAISGRTLGDALGTSRTSANSTLDALVECGYVAMHPRRREWVVFRTPDIPAGEWEAARTEAAAVLGSRPSPEPGSESPGLVRFRVLETFVERALERGRAPTYRELAEAVGRASSQGPVEWLLAQGYLVRCDKGLRLALACGDEGVAVGLSQRLDRRVWQRLAEDFERLAADGPCRLSVDSVADRYAMTPALARQMVVRVADGDPAVRWLPETDEVVVGVRDGA